MHPKAATPRSTGNSQEPDRKEAKSAIEIQQSLKRFRQDHPSTGKTAFIMMRFGNTATHDKIVQSIRDFLQPHGFAALRADQKQYPNGVLWDGGSTIVRLVAMVLFARDAYGTWRDYLKKLGILFRTYPGLQNQLLGSKNSEDFCLAIRRAEISMMK